MNPLKLLPTAVFLIILTSACSAGTILGHTEAEWLDALGEGRSLPIPARARLGELTRLGPGTLLFMAMQASTRQDQDTTRQFLQAAVEHETGMYGRFAAERYLQLLLAEADGPGLLAFVTSPGSRNLVPWIRATTEATALSMTGRHAQALAAWIRLRTDHPQESADNSIAVSSGVLLAASQRGTPEATRLIREEFRFLLGMPGSNAWYKAMAEIIAALETNPAASAVLEEHELLLAKARVLSGTREYGASILAFRRLSALTNPAPAADTETPPPGTSSGGNAGQLRASSGALLASNLSRPALSDLTRAFLSGSRTEGEAIFALLAAGSQSGNPDSRTAGSGTRLPGADPGKAYLYQFWAGRFARAAEKWREAASLFATAARLAQAPEDLDSALWYEAECRSKYSSSEAIAVLAKAYAHTGNPAYYSDLLEPLSRKALADRAGATLAAITAAAAPAGTASSGATARDRARLDYLTARAAATGIISAGQLRQADPAGFTGSLDGYVEAALFRAYQQDADPWYRLLAAYRLRLPLVDPADGPGAPAPPPGPVIATADQLLADQTIPRQAQADQGISGQTAPSPAPLAEPEEQLPLIVPENPGEADAFARGLIRFGLAAMARTELGPAYRDLAPSTIRALAEALTQAGDYGMAIRAMAPLFSRPGYVPTLRDRQLYWPQAFLPETRDAAGRFSLPEALLFGLVRSESLFQPTVVSSAGAVGLAQLMPATAAETAGRLRMAEYDVTKPADNLALGASYFKRILDNRNGRFMPAIFSYNAGPTRFLRWENQYGPLPMDLLLEVLDYAETRQYGRNVVAATMAYAALYYKDNLHGFLASLLGE